jgi:uncharacterized membrane protein
MSFLLLLILLLHFLTVADFWRFCPNFSCVPAHATVPSISGVPAVAGVSADAVVPSFAGVLMDIKFR